MLVASNFLSSSLASLVKIWVKPILSNWAKNFIVRYLIYLSRKGFYQYDYMSGFEKFKEELLNRK